MIDFQPTHPERASRVQMEEGRKEVGKRKEKEQRRRKQFREDHRMCPPDTSLVPAGELRHRLLLFCSVPQKSVSFCLYKWET